MIGVIIVFGTIGYIMFGLPMTAAFIYLGKGLYKYRGN